MRVLGFASLLVSIALAGGVSAERAATAEPTASQSQADCEDPFVTEGVVDETRHPSSREMLKALGTQHVVPLNTRGYNYDFGDAPETPPPPPAKPVPPPTRPAPKQSVPTRPHPDPPTEDAPPAAAR